MLYSGIYAEVDRKVYQGNILPKHGPGSTAERITGNQKYAISTWPVRLDTVFPAMEYAVPHWQTPTGLPNMEDREETLPIRRGWDGGSLEFIEPGTETPVRIVTVPKTLKTPRIIAIEPVAMQYMQQGILECFDSEVQRDYLLRNFIGWKTQEPNQLLARKGSREGTLATLDLSEASDRVLNSLVIDMMKLHPWLNAGVQASRSMNAKMPGEMGIIPLVKFASMGSALCFPIEAMVFLTIVLSGIQRQLKRQITQKDLRSLLGQVRVYGDDIIVPVDYVQSVISELQTFGLKVNSNKSFWTGKFRESCGKEYYDGFDVSIVRVREVFPTSRRHALQIASIVSLRNQLFKQGFRSTVAYLDDIICGLIPFPYVSEESEILGRLSEDGSVTVTRWDPLLQRPLVRGAVLKERIPRDKLDGYAALMKFFLKRGDLPIFDRNHLERAARPLSVDIMTRWASPV